MARVRRQLGYSQGFDVSANGSCGGLSIGWTRDVSVSIRSFSIFHIDADISVDSPPSTWRFTGFYGNPVESLREDSWNLLRSLSENQNLPWLVMGDFNEILLSSEKEGGRLRPNRNMEAFRSALEDCGLMDLGFTGHWYTWEKGRLSTNVIRERLDRGVANSSWWDSFPDFSVQHLSHSMSDHCPVLLTHWHPDSPSDCFNEQAFKFNANWTLEESCEPLIKEFWTGNNLTLPSKLEMLGTKLIQWQKENKRIYGKQSRTLKERLSSLAHKDPDDDVLAEILDVKLALNLEADKEELYWEQRARVNWLRHGDRNTTFFHKWASYRKKKNTITKLQDDSGTWVTDEGAMESMATGFYANLFTSAGSIREESILNGIRTVVDNDMNRMLLLPFRKDELFAALQDMAPLKASGSDGYPALFYQKYWHIVGEEVSNFCLNILNNSGDISCINDANIVLIPKVENPANMTQFRPISLCNVLYKIIAKAIVNRLSPLLDQCIDDTQGAFVANRHITDNILIAYEVLHSLKMRRGGRNGSFALKLDMSKAYDRVEWPFITSIMSRMGFDDRWVSLVMRCVESVSYRVLFNGKVSEGFRPTRGLWQGDPLSPYLFLFCAQGLSTLLHSAKANNTLKGVKVGRQGITLTHLFFADDCILFGDASTHGATIMRDLLLCYERASGQKVNFEKSLIYFSNNLNQNAKDDIGALLGVRISNNPEKYLGLPTMVGRNKQEAFAGLRDRTNKKVEGWSVKFLSMGGKEVFLKSVLQAIPVYAMQCFLFPLSLCNALESIYNRFWWRNNSSGKGIHWSRWFDLCASKDMGGMGFRNLAKFNIAILAKQGWHILTRPNGLLARVLKGKYFPNGSFMDSNLGSNPSYTWKSIWACRGLLEKGVSWMVGDGKSINVWNDSWVPGLKDGRVSVDPIPLQYSWVSDLIEDNSSNAHSWKEEVIRRIFPDDQANLILSIKLPTISIPDEYRWRFESSGNYTVKSGYKFLMGEENFPRDNITEAQLQAKQVFSKIWSSSIPSKVQVMCWRFINNYIPTKENLHYRRLPVSTDCLLCSSSPESVKHILQCSYFLQVLSELHIDISMIPMEQQWLQWLSHLFEKLSTEAIRLFFMTIWAVWTYRNKRMHDNCNQRPKDVAHFIKQYLCEIDASRTHISKKAATQSESWIPPPMNYVKVNYDDSFQSVEKKSFSGVIIRNTQGLIMAAGSYPNSLVPNPEVAEALACRHAVTLAMELGFHHAQIEGDSLNINKKLSVKSCDRSLTGPIIRDIKRIKRGLRDLSFRYSHRTTNMAAHLMAKEGRRIDSTRVWIEEAPNSVEAAAREDRIRAGLVP
ncbi:hypothetical protein HRI_000914500 [Hibiscus trionum]|uniref:Reverse transcriptase domain-containing protein n=1 Tax=Hibiscus trionum TaxID=183268 RepID=A0A9W7LPK3_HIBTR|nr:hypothetical protein HRI_000914500 [Hibiscus trionum]